MVMIISPKRIGRISIVFLLFFSNLAVFAQLSTVSDSISTDGLFAKARDYAYGKKRVEARSVCRQILQRDSTYRDAAVLIGRTYAWDGKYDSSRIVLNHVIEQRPGYYDAIGALIDLEGWSDNYPAAIRYADIGLSYHPNDAGFLYKKARILNNSGESKKAVVILNQILKANPSDKDAASLMVTIREGNRLNKLSVHYSTYTFSNDNPWSFASASIGRKTSAFGTVTLRYNYARRFGSDGNQVEIDAYPAIAKGIYMYFNTGISNKKNFPYSRLSMEPYLKLPASFEMSLGFRYMNFDDHRLVALDSNKVMIYTGTIGKYYGNYWFSVRPYFTKGKENWSKSVNLTVRRYLADPESYFSLILGTGISPDEQQYAFDPNYFLKSSKIDLDYQQKIAKRFSLNCGTGFAREEIRAGVKRNRFSFDIGISYMF